MNNFLEFCCIALLLLLASCSNQSQYPQINEIKLNVNVQHLKSKSQVYNHGFLFPLNNELAIAQFGAVKIFHLNINDGTVVDRLNQNFLDSFASEVILPTLGPNYFIPSDAEYQRNRRFANLTPRMFHNVFYLSDKDKFASIITYIAFNRKDHTHQRIVSALFHFDENLDIIDIFPLIGGIEYSTGINTGGFFLGHSRLFTKIIPFLHSKPYDFLEYKLIDENYFMLLDSLPDIQTSKTGYGSRFFTTFQTNNISYLNLGKGFLSFDGKNISEGKTHLFPLEPNFSCLYIEPITDQYFVGYFVNDYENEAKSIGKLVLIDAQLEGYETIDSFDLTRDRFCSFFVRKNQVYLMNYQFENKQFNLLKYSNIL
ncbi:MAG: hypothetical protein EA409_02760 [Saprospirales bacterium]|nr:MAG: hypothetical protein EA409_02760 [Saprospirales bacterium]